MKVCIFGVGAIGTYVAAHIARAGHAETSVVARGATLAAIRADGLRLVTPTEAFAARPIATDDTTALGPQDYLFLTLKAHQLTPALDEISPLIGPHTVIVPPTTGIPYYFFHGAAGPHHDRRLDHVDPGGLQWRALPPAQVLGCVYWIGAHGAAPGVAQQDGAHAGMPIGELDGSRSERAVRLSELLAASGIRAPVRDNVRGEIWIKFVNSLCWNPLAMLTLARLGEIGAAPGVLALGRAMMAEADAVGRALGVAIPQAIDKRVATTLGAGGHKMSMLQDLERSRTLELAPLRDSLTDMAALAGLATPRLDDVLALAGLRAAIAERQDAGAAERQIRPIP